LEENNLIFATQANGFYAFIVCIFKEGVLPIGTILHMAKQCSSKIIVRYVNNKTYHPDIERILKMKQLGEKLIYDNGHIGHYCLGCDSIHFIKLRKKNDDKPSWTFNHDLINPTFDPSIKISWKFKDNPKICHYFIIDGKVNYCQNSTHDYAGKSVFLELPKSVLEDWSITEKLNSIPSENEGIM
jgi:Family of unknown function (DUF6527)